MAMAGSSVLLDAGVFIGALLLGDPRGPEAYPLVEAARRGDLPACTTASVLSEVYAALTWAGSGHPHPPATAARVVSELVDAPSAILVLGGGLSAAMRHLELAVSHGLTARRIHDARHAAIALEAGVTTVYTYDVEDWRAFATDGITIAGPPSVLPLL